MVTLFLTLLFIFDTGAVLYSASDTHHFDPAILAVFTDIHDGKEVELEKMVCLF